MVTQATPEVPAVAGLIDFYPGPPEHFHGDLPVDRVVIDYQAVVSDIEVTSPLSIVNTATVFGASDVNQENDTAISEVVIMPPNDCVYLDRNVFVPSSGEPLKIFFQLSTERSATLELYDITGYHLMTLADQTFSAGINTVLWNGNLTNGRPIGSGVYLITFKSKGLMCWTKVIVAQ